MRKVVQTDTVVHTYAELAAEVLPRHFRPDCCVNASRVFVEVMKRLKLPAAAVVTQSVAYNPAWARLQAEHGGPPTPELSDVWAAQGGYCVACAGQEVTDGFPWHLVGVTKGYIVDCASGQMSRPKRDLVVPPTLVTETAAGFGNGGFTVNHPLDDGGIVTYKAAPGVEYKHIDGWQMSPWNREVTDEMYDLLVSTISA